MLIATAKYLPFGRHRHVNVTVLKAAYSCKASRFFFLVLFFSLYFHCKNRSHVLSKVALCLSATMDSIMKMETICILG